MPEVEATDVLREAARWFAVLQDDGAGERERERWREWLSADPRHEAAWRRVEAMGLRFAQLPNPLDRRAARQALTAARHRRSGLKLVAAGGVGAFFVWLLLSEQAWQRLTADYRTGVGERRELPLPEGSRV